MAYSTRDIIGHIESGYNEHVMRFEPQTYMRVTVPPPLPTSRAGEVLAIIRQFNKCSSATAAMIYSTSWGVFQDMGFTLYGELGWRQPVLQFDYAAQCVAFDEYVKDRNIAYTIDELRNNPISRERFAMGYNGPGAVAEYAEKIRATIALLAPAA